MEASPSKLIESTRCHMQNSFEIIPSLDTTEPVTANASRAKGGEAASNGFGNRALQTSCGA